jgi:hypothetical protein
MRGSVGSEEVMTGALVAVELVVDTIAGGRHGISK